MGKIRCGGLELRIALKVHPVTIPHKHTVCADVLFSVMRMRHRGRSLPRRELANRERASGDLRVEQIFDEDLRRYLRMARLLDPSRPVDADRLPPLYDPGLMAMSPLAFTLAGFERVDGIDYAQSWLIMLPRLS